MVFRHNYTHLHEHKNTHVSKMKQHLEVRSQLVHLVHSITSLTINNVSCRSTTTARDMTCVDIYSAYLINSPEQPLGQVHIVLTSSMSGLTDSHIHSRLYQVSTKLLHAVHHVCVEASDRHNYHVKNIPQRIIWEFPGILSQ